ncbi:unnamed protein product [Urochloa decumbens]|uniref:Receptor kinase-like protein Xa21 n=1 Tax=Urochloa decumbens TaxID=240449 RepID=A0ABC9C1D9_9POAL
MLLRPTTTALVLLLAAMACTHAAAATVLSTDHDGDDEKALQDFKEKASSGLSGLLSSWNSSASYCSWEGVKCGRRHPRRVVSLHLSLGLGGTISPAIGNLTFLQSINLTLNALHGEIPPSIGSLRRLQYLDLRYNSLIGTIPGNISRCTSLKVMDIADNKGLQGRIPPEIGNMPMLTILDLFNNSITGTIPASVGNLSRLEVLSLAYNHLEGSIPPGIGNNPHLTFLQLSNNSLSGELPPSLYNMSSLETFFAAGNRLHGHLPQDLGTSLHNVELFGLGDNQFTGAIPTSLTNLSSLRHFSISFNKFSGVIPSELNRLQSLEWLMLDTNEFEANNEKEWEFLTSLTNCSRLQVLTVISNKLAGKLPTSLTNLSTSLQILRFLDNSISGDIPPGIGNLMSLEHLDLSENFLTGIIPESTGELTKLEGLYLGQNNLSASIPSSIGNLTSLVEFTVNANSLEGPIPSAIGNLEKLSVLDLSSNSLTGVIPREVVSLSSLSLYLDLSHNLLEGPLPSEVGSLVNLAMLAVSGNRLSGIIPHTISNCIVLQILQLDGNLLQGNIPPVLKNIEGLTVLNLTDNKLNGTIPVELGSITNLQELYLGHNNLSGAIPELLGNSTSLLHLDLSFNNLQGEVPKEGIFKDLTGLSIFGNNELCGGIPLLHLPKCPNSTARKNKKAMPMSLRIVVPIVGALLVLLLAAFLYRRSKADTKKELPPYFGEIDLPMISYNEIHKGTDGFSDLNLLGKGRYGSVYRCVVENQEIVMAVKVFNLQQSGSYKSFQAECEALRRVRHRCLVKIITCCSSVDHQGQDFRALVFEFMPKGSLDNWINSHTESQSGNGTLTLEQRLDIAVDIADAIDYLHNGCETSIIHCDLKPSNILLTGDMRARVGDFGIARILNEAESRTTLNSSSTIGIRGSIGYVAPEYGEGLAVSTYGDVYSFGITLIEMFIGRCPTDDMFRDGLSLHDFAAAALPDEVIEIADPKILLHGEANNSNSTRNITRTKECLAATIQLGVLCSKQSPRERLLMSDVAIKMHNIRETYLRTP